MKTSVRSKDQSPAILTGLAKRFFLLWEKPGLAMLMALLAFYLYATYNGSVLKPTVVNYYSYQADAFLHGQLALRILPESTHDLLSYHDNYYLYWAPFPALLVTPLVLFLGVNFSDILLTIFIGGINVALVAFLLRSLNQYKITSTSPLQRGILVLVFTLGSPFVTQPPLGTVWSTGLLVGLMTVLLTYLVALRLDGWKAFLLAGLCISAAMATRYQLLFAGIWPAYILLSRNWNKNRRELFSLVFIGCLPIILTGLGLAWFNLARFGSLTSVGLEYQKMSNVFADDVKQYGFFNIHYVPRNLYYHWIAYPLLVRNLYKFSLGGSLFLLTPLYLAALAAVTDRKQRTHVILLFAICIIIYIPSALLYATGWVQFGFRYMLDFAPPLLILVAIGMQRWPNRINGILAAISLLQFTAGFLVLIQFIL